MEDALVKAVQAAVKAEVGQMEGTVRRAVRAELSKLTPDRPVPTAPPSRITLAKISPGARPSSEETKQEEESDEAERGGEPHASFSHQARDGTWAPYSDEQCSLIAGAIDASPAGGVLRLPGIPFEVRWGGRATSLHVTAPPPTGMLQVNVKNENTHYVRQDAAADRGARGAAAARDGPASLRACVALAAAPPTVDLRFEAFGDDGAERLGAWLRAVPSADGRGVERLLLPACGIGARGARHIAEALIARPPFCASLRQLNLSMNALGDEGAAAVAALVAARPREGGLLLKLGDNKIGEPGARALCAAAVDRLRALFLDNNHLQNDAARHVAKLLRADARLEHLCLDKNAVGDDGVREIAQAVRANAASRLAQLELDANLFAKKGVQALRELVSSGASKLERITADGRLGDFEAIGLKQRKVSRKMGVGEELADIFDAARDLERFRANRNQRLLVRGHYWVVRLWDVCVGALCLASVGHESCTLAFGVPFTRPHRFAFWVTEWCFVLDVALNFSMTYYDEYNEERFDRWDIARNYIFGSQPPWALVDIAALVPFMARGVFGIARGVDALAARGRAWNHPLGFVGLLVLLRVKPFVDVWRTAQITSRPSWRFAFLAVVTFTAVHFLGCWYFRTRLDPAGTFRDVELCQDADADDCAGGDFGDAYFFALFWAMMAIVGEMDVPSTGSERTLTLVAYVIGLFLNAVLIGEVALALEKATTSPMAQAEREQLERVQLCLSHHGVPRETARRIVRFYGFAWRARRGSLSLDEIAEPLPPKLRIELEVGTLASKCQRIPFLSAFEGEIVMQFLRGLTMSVIMPGEDVFRRGEPAQAMVYVLLGYMVVQDEVGTVLFSVIPGMSVGEGALLSEARRHIVTLRNPNHGTDHGDWCEIASLSAESFDALIEAGGSPVRHYFEESSSTRINTIRAARKVSISSSDSYANLQNFIASEPPSPTQSPTSSGRTLGSAFGDLADSFKKYRYVTAFDKIKNALDNLTNYDADDLENADKNKIADQMRHYAHLNDVPMAKISAVNAFRRGSDSAATAAGNALHAVTHASSHRRGKAGAVTPDAT